MAKIAEKAWLIYHAQAGSDKLNNPNTSVGQHHAPIKAGTENKTIKITQHVFLLLNSSTSSSFPKRSSSMSSPQPPPPYFISNPESPKVFCG